MTPIIVKVKHGLPGLGEMELICNGYLIVRYGRRLYRLGDTIPLALREEDADALQMAIEEAPRELQDQRH